MFLYPLTYLVDVEDVRRRCHCGGESAARRKDPVLESTDEVDVRLTVLLAASCVHQEVQAVLHPVETKGNLD